MLYQYLLLCPSWLFGWRLKGEVPQQAARRYKLYQQDHWTSRNSPVFLFRHNLTVSGKYDEAPSLTAKMLILTMPSQAPGLLKDVFVTFLQGWVFSHFTHTYQITSHIMTRPERKAWNSHWPFSAGVKILVGEEAETIGKMEISGLSIHLVIYYHNRLINGSFCWKL